MQDLGLLSPIGSSGHGNSIVQDPIKSSQGQGKLKLLIEPNPKHIRPTCGVAPLQPQPHPPRDLKSCDVSFRQRLLDVVKTRGRLTTTDPRNAQTEASSNVNTLFCLRNSRYICHKAINSQSQLNQGTCDAWGWCLRQG